jgi:hypothetical protein
LVLALSVVKAAAAAAVKGTKRLSIVKCSEVSIDS